MSKANTKTITKWDNKMIENDILKNINDEFNSLNYFYVACDFKINKDTMKIERQYRLTDVKEYRNFLKVSKSISMKNKVLEKFKSGKITNEECNLLLDGITYNQISKSQKVVYRVNKFKIGKNKELLNTILELVKELYIDDINKYII